LIRVFAVDFRYPGTGNQPQDQNQPPKWGWWGGRG
jgi:hypothetical protein